MHGFIVPDASYEGGGSRAKCLKGTRESVIAEILTWKDDIDAKPIRWLSGPAGFGKSAVSQTVAEVCAKDGMLMASHFFLRGAGGRSEFSRFITTLAFRITLSVPDTKPLIEQALRGDPTIPHQSIAHQLYKLILSPLMALRNTLPTSQPFLIVIDALDECDDRAPIKEFITVLADACGTCALPLRWLLTSRREEHIRQAFSEEKVQSKTASTALEDFDAGEDIERFLTSRFSEIRQQNPRILQGMPFPWPSLEDLLALVNKSSGLFVFASTLADFVTDGQAPPQQKLKSVLSLHAGLDLLYTQVLKAVPNIVCFRRVLTALMLLHEQPSVNLLAELLRLDAGDVLHALTFIQSIIHVPADDNTPIRLNHTSLRDFLVDSSRSKDLYIDPPATNVALAIGCIMLMNSNLRRDEFPEKGAAVLYAVTEWGKHVKDSAASHVAFPELITALNDFYSSEVIKLCCDVLIHRLGVLGVEKNLRNLNNGRELLLILKKIVAKQLV